MISEHSKVTKCTDLMESVIDNEAVILGMESGKYIGLDEIATKIWSRLDQPVDVSDIILDLTDIYDENEIVIKEHVIEFLNDLLTKYLIREVDENQL